MARSAVWAGVDVGGQRKGFHVALLDRDLHVQVTQWTCVDLCATSLAEAQPVVVAIDSPSAWAAPGQLSRECEREFRASGLCGIRFTPNEAVADQRADRYLEWIEVGLELWHALAAAGVPTVECFPTVSWTAWLGHRGVATRAAWSRGGIDRLRDLGVSGLAAVRNQDQRDAVAAALTARQQDRQQPTVVTYGDLTVPQVDTLDYAVA
jgi:predicted nuclease with RNAse H fold